MSSWANVLVEQRGIKGEVFSKSYKTSQSSRSLTWALLETLRGLQQHNLCWTGPTFRQSRGGKDSLFITQQFQLILFPLSPLYVFPTRPKLKPVSLNSVP